MHKSVLLKEAVSLLDVKEKGGIYVDATFGFGGHSREILKKMSDEAVLIGFDADAESLLMNAAQFENDKRFIPVHANFSQIKEKLFEMGIETIDGALYDLGVSSMHLDEASRGFSFTHDGPLDMRLDRSRGITAADVVNTYRKEELVRLLREYGEERMANRVAEQIIRARPLSTTLQLASAVERALGRKKPSDRIHPATRAFQAIRIEVNSELKVLEKSVEACLGMLKPGGRIAVISFHSLEDRIVKNIFRRESEGCICENKRLPCTCAHTAKVKLITKKPVLPGPEETEINPRARSAKLRCAEKI